MSIIGSARLSSNNAPITDVGVAGVATASGDLTFRTRTQQENEELKGLYEEREQETKRLKLEKFKKLPPELRQAVADAIQWSKAVQEINATEAPITDRERELQVIPAGYFSHQAVFSGFAGINSTPAGWFVLPNGITKDDLLKAHSDATLEETLKENSDEQT